MSNRRAKRKPKQSKSIDWEFITINVPRERREHVKETFVKGRRLEQFIQQFVDSGLKVSFNWAERDDAYRVVVSAPATDAHNPKTSLSYTHTDIKTALGVITWYATEVCAEGNWTRQEDDKEHLHW